MKFLTFIVLLMLVLAQFLKTDTIISEPEIMEFKQNGYTVYVSCIDGHKYMFFRETVVQMTETYIAGQDSKMIPVTVPAFCK